MDSSFEDTADGIIYAETGSFAPARLPLAAIGLIAIMASAGFVAVILPAGVHAAGAPTPGAMLAAAAGVIAFCGFGGYCLWLALSTPRQTVVFDTARRALLHTTRSPLRGTRTAHHAFAEVSGVTVERHVPDDGDPTWCIAVVGAGHLRIEMGVFAQCAPATMRADRIRSAIEPHPASAAAH